MMINNSDSDDTQPIFTLKPGAEFSHYRLLKKIGVGGMGEVYLAEDTMLHRKIALKFLSANFTSDNEFRERFLREARSAAVLNHPNIITIYEVADFKGYVYIAMEFVEGNSIRELLDKKELDLDFGLDLMLQMCDGLAAAHKEGLVHRDIKPHNVIVDTNNRVRILDFGLAKIEGDKNLTQTGTVLGTVNYMSPEQAQGMITDYRSDIFSLGILFYEMITGNVPFNKGNVPATIYSIVHDNPVSLNECSPTLAYDLQFIIDKVLAKSISDRYQNILDLKNDIISSRYDAQLRATVIHRPQTTTTIQKVETQVKSLAVLYLRNLGDDKDEYLSYGITEDLIIDLTRIGTIRVSPMRSIMQFKDSNADFEEIRDKLNVNVVLDGSILKSESTIRVSVQLIDLRNGETLGSERWEEPLSNLPQIKKSLADTISALLNVGKTVIAAAQVGQPLATDAQAYDYYLKAKYYFDHKKDKQDVETAYELYSQALNEDKTLLAAKVGIAEIDIYNGNFDDAKDGLEEALREAQSSNSKAEQVNILQLLSRYYAKHSELDTALTYGENALEKAQEMGDLAGEADILGILISILQQQAKFEKIFVYFDRVIEISRKQEDNDKIAEALKNMGITYMRKGDYDKADQMYDEAYDLAGKQKNLSLQAACLSNKGTVCYFRGDLSEAFNFYKRSLDISDKIGDKAISANQNSNMALIKLTMGDFIEGIALLQNTIDIYEELGDRSKQSIMLINMCQARLTIGEVDTAIKIGEEALIIAEEVNHPLAHSDCHLHLGLAYYYSQKYELAVGHINESLKIAEDVSNNRNQALCYLIYSRIYFNKQEKELCRKNAEKSFSIAKEIGEKSIKLQAAVYLGSLTVSEGLYNTGLKQMEDAIKELSGLKSHEAIIVSKSIYGFTLTKFGKTDADKILGRETLNEVLEFAREKKIFIEVKEIEHLINFTDSTY